MNRASRWIAGGLWLGLASTGAGCYVAPAPPPPASPAMEATGDATVYPTTPPPDPIPEYPPPSPGYGYTWIGGYWDWSGYDWSWEPGYWAPQEVGYAYVGPRFVFIDGRPVYYRAYWRGPGGRVVYGYGPRGAPPARFRARPSVAPSAWRAEPAHSAGWQRAPGAASFHGAPAARGPAPGGFHGAAPAAGTMRPAPAPAGGGFHSAPAAGGFHPAPAGGGFHAAPAPHAAPARGGGFHRK